MPAKLVKKLKAEAKKKVKAGTLSSKDVGAYIYGNKTMQKYRKQGI